jgi:hypothetical protein
MKKRDSVRRNPPPDRRQKTQAKESEGACDVLLNRAEFSAGEADATGVAPWGFSKDSDSEEP